MPTYQFECKDCNTEFEVIASVAEYERMKRERTVRCTACGSTNVETEIVAFEVRTARKTA